jgi:arsenical pump membrane protein
VNQALALGLALLLLAATLAVAVLRPRGWPEWPLAVGGAALLLATGTISLRHTRAALGDLGSTVGFLAALLVLSEGCRRQGVFDLLAAVVRTRAGGRAGRLFGLVFAVCTAVTVVLGLDATVVLLTPIILATALGLRLDAKPSAYACAHLANTASLLLPVSNLTNLLAFRAAGISFTRFGALMALPFVVAVAVEWWALRRFFGVADDPAPAAPARADDAAAPELAGAARYALLVLGLTLAGFASSSLVSVAPLWIAVAGAVLIVAPSLWRGGPAVAGELILAAEPGFLAFVLALGVIVRAAADHGLRTGVIDVLPAGGSLPDLLLIAVVSAVLANLVNNLPATLILVPVAAALGLGPLLAVLVGVNLGPNLTYGGSLATLLWRRIVAPAAVTVELSEFTRLGLLTVVPGIPVVTTAVWVSVKLIGR